MMDYEIIFRGLSLSQAPYHITTIEGIGSPELRNQEIEISNEDGITFGREYYGARKWTISGNVKGGNAFQPSVPSSSDVGDAWDAMSSLIALWDMSDVRVEERDITFLTFQRPGRNPVIAYGRPERIDSDITTSYAGFISYQALFRQSDPKFYASTETSMTKGISVAYAGGILLGAFGDTITSPFTTTSATSVSGAIRNNGDTSSWPTITINGPVLNPLVQLKIGSNPLWSVQLKTSIVSNQSVVIDTRPWVRSVTRSDGANVAGTMRGSRLGEMTVPTGTSVFVYDGQDSTATSTVEIRFRDAWAGL